MTFELSGTPDWVAQALLTSTSADAPRAGELWSLAWDGEFQGTAVIAVVQPDHVLALPVTDDAASGTEIVLHHDGVNLSLWPQGETGLGIFLLHARLGALLTDAQVLELRRWEAQRGELHTLSTGTGTRTREQLSTLLEHYRELCFIEWPSDAEATLNLDAVAMEPLEFATQTGLPAARVLAIWGGLPPTADERATIAAQDESWLSVSPDSATLSLSAPEVKDLFVELTSLMGGDERAARNAARRDFALAARTESAVARNATRAADTVRTLVEEARAALD